MVFRRFFCDKFTAWKNIVRYFQPSVFDKELKMAISAATSYGGTSTVISSSKTYGGACATCGKSLEAHQYVNDHSFISRSSVDSYQKSSSTVSANTYGKNGTCAVCGQQQSSNAYWSAANMR
jgi:hypothetical protein